VLRRFAPMPGRDEGRIPDDGTTSAS
jgi:hypothetical protein